MQKYLFLYHTPTSGSPSAPPSPEEIQAMLATWSAWKEKFAANVTDMGDGLKPGGRLLAGGVVTDGAFVEAKEVIGGYSIISATSYDEAVTVARECPITYIPGAAIEIRELAGF
ncbi:MAG: hypothetical protein IT385_05210 [Deltaproteobacteria bacterium]|nr:hypothetical protein [Deltaproteobacteria bacterium]